MPRLHDLYRRIFHVLGPACGLLAIAYFAFHAMHGDRGVLAWRHLDQKVQAAHAELDALRAERERLEHRVRLMHPQSLDKDMLDESVRRVLGYGRPDEFVIFTDHEEGP